MAQPDKPGGGRKVKPEHNVLVHGSIQTYPSPEVTKAHKAEREEDAGTHGAERTVDLGRESQKVWLELLTLLAVIVYAGIAGWQGCLTREAITNNTKQFNMSNRPWVGLIKPIEATNSLSFDESGAHIEGRLTIKNTGTSPALQAVNMGGLVVGETYPLPPKFMANQAFICDPTFGRVIAQSQVGLVVLPGVESAFAPGKLEARKIDIPTNMSQVSVYAVVCVVYSDQIGVQHGTSYVSRFVADDGRLSFPPTGNILGHFEDFGMSKAY